MHWQHSSSTLRPRWFETDEIIKHWLKERQALLILYYELCRLVCSHHPQTAKAMLPKFCQILIDYVSAGHFEVFEKLADAEAKCLPEVSLDRDLLVKILGTTHMALLFNDKHSPLKDFATLREDLSALGEQLADRMKWEDLLIKEYLKITREPPAPSPASRAPSI